MSCDECGKQCELKEYYIPGRTRKQYCVECLTCEMCFEPCPDYKVYHSNGFVWYSCKDCQALYTRDINHQWSMIEKLKAELMHHGKPWTLESVGALYGWMKLRKQEVETLYGFTGPTETATKTEY